MISISGSGEAATEIMIVDESVLGDAFESSRLSELLVS